MVELKAATAAHHERLERRVDIQVHLRSRAAYRALLERFYGFHRPVEAVLAPFAGPFTPRHPALAADITALGGDPARVPLAPLLPAVHSVQDALGVLYVLEGSALGGAVIGRMVERDLGLRSAFFARRGIAPRWRAFGEYVERHAPVPPQAAITTFERMEDWICP
jgi:heme oxygenase